MGEIDAGETALTLEEDLRDGCDGDGAFRGCVEDPVELCGGALSESMAGEGPLAPIAVPRGDGPASADDDTQRVTYRGSESVLVVEDDEVVRRYAVRCLEGLGFEVTGADSGAAALEQLRGPTAFDVVFSDVLMPGCLTGYDLAEYVQKEAGSSTAVLLASGCLASERAQVEGGRCEFLSKPYTCEQLGRRLRALLDQRRR
ncbi:MAG: hypothetical protein CMJ83_19535 [Planctomycetes bacterium]|nr:hypothetical protein [Planctomycetota bacterium]